MWKLLGTNTTSPQAFHSQTLPFMATRIGTFRMDLGIIFDQPGTEPSSLGTSQPDALSTGQGSACPEMHSLQSLVFFCASELLFHEQPPRARPEP